MTHTHDPRNAEAKAKAVEALTAAAEKNRDGSPKALVHITAADFCLLVDKATTKAKKPPK